jgi:hypothetical protein
MEPRKPYPPDLNDYAWDLTTHLLPEATPGGRPEQYPKREILNGIFSIVHDWRGGCSRTISHLGRLSIMTSDYGAGTAPGSYVWTCSAAMCAWPLANGASPVLGLSIASRLRPPNKENHDVNAHKQVRGFPWTQYGIVSANEVQNGRARVELAVRSDAVPPIPLQHGLPETVEVEVDCVSPAALILCTAGLLLTVPGTSRDFQGTRGADR